MASQELRLSANVPGDFFVDSTCIDCDACRILAPAVFSDAGDQSFVHHQPESEEELHAARKALITCPTASIGTVQKHDMRAAVADLPTAQLAAQHGLLQEGVIDLLVCGQVQLPQQAALVGFR